MKILLDENLDWRLCRDLPGHDVKAVPLIGWAGLKNGALLAKAEKEFDVLVTMDNNIYHEQKLSKYQIAVVALRAKSNRLADTRPLMSKVLAALPAVRPGQLALLS